MKRFRITFILFIIVNCQFPIFSSLQAQETFTDRLQKTVAGQGIVRLHQDVEIANLVNGKRWVSVPPSSLRVHPQVVDTLADTLSLPPAPVRKIRISGYRVQVYAGGNSRDAKQKAYQMENRVKIYFPDQPVYTRFVSPRWICHVGDFQTREEALELLENMRHTGSFPEAITVKCKINAFVYEEQ